MDWDLKEALEYYKRLGAPGDQNVLISLLREIQGEYGGIPAGLLPEVAAFYGIRESLLTALIRRIPSLRLTADRLGHDRRYATNADKLKALGWVAQYRFVDAFAHTVRWYVEHPKYWD